MISLALNGIIAALLVATIAYCVILSRRLRDLRDSRGEFVELIKTFDTATERAEAGLSELRKASKESGATLDERIKAARALSDDLAFLVERGGPIADRLAGKTGDARKPASSPPRPRTVPLPPSGPEAPRDDADDGAAQASRSIVERDLVTAIRAARQE